MNDNKPNSSTAPATETVDVLNRQIAIARNKVWKIEAAERYEKAKKLIGKSFRYRNSYSCPEGEKDRWWLYMRVTGVSKDGFLTVFSFQIDKDGQITIEPEKRRMHESNLGEPITLKKFRHAWKILVRGINYRAKDAGAIP